MKNININFVLIICAIVAIISCTKEDSNLNDLNETIFVRHKKADMPAYIYGNASEKVFLVILHGGPGGNGLQYRNRTIKTVIEKNNAVVYFDQRGSGNAQGSYDSKGVSLDIMAEDVVALARVLKDKYGSESKIFLMGHSWGGTLGPATLLKNQDLFAGWIDVDGEHSPAASYELYKTVLTDAANEQIAAGNSVDHWKNTLETVKNVSATYNDDDFFKLNRAAHKGEDKYEKDSIVNPAPYIENAQNIFHYDYVTGNWNTFRIVHELFNQDTWKKTSFTDRLSEITIPSLVLWGKYDLIVPFAKAQEAYDNLGSTNKELFIFEKSGHSPMANEPDLFADKVISFINMNK